MSAEMIAIFGVGIVLAGLILNGQRIQRMETRAQFKAMRDDIRKKFDEFRELMDWNNQI